jgi:hypothetical protein
MLILTVKKIHRFLDVPLVDERIWARFIPQTRWRAGLTISAAV